MKDGFTTGCLGAFILTVVGILLLRVVGAAGDGQSGMIIFLTIPLGAYIGSNWKNWRSKS